jgi:hypothetical protein
MGGKLSCPSEVLDSVWMKDDTVNFCTNCGGGVSGGVCPPGQPTMSNLGGGVPSNAVLSASRQSFSSGSFASSAASSARNAQKAAEQGKFSLTNRRHHCRSCGIIVCSACWGTLAALEPIYGFPGPVPICSVCADIFMPTGAMNLLRRGVVVAFTHEPRSNVTDESQIAPLHTANIKARRFTTNYLRIHKWRPFTRRTAITLTKTKSSREVLRARSGLPLGAAAAASAGGGTTPRGRGNNSARDSGGLRDSATGAAGSGGEWTIDLDAVESIQLMTASEREGGDYILISTDFEEHRLQAVKMRFEEMATVNSAAADAVESASRAASDRLGGERDDASASDNRSKLSSGTRLRTVMLDPQGTIDLFKALIKAHATCARRRHSMPAEMKQFLDLDPPASEIEDVNSGDLLPSTPRAMPLTPRASAAALAAGGVPIPVRSAGRPIESGGSYGGSVGGLRSSRTATAASTTSASASAAPAAGSMPQSPSTVGGESPERSGKLSARRFPPLAPANPPMTNNYNETRRSMGGTY